MSKDIKLDAAVEIPHNEVQKEAALQIKDLLSTSLELKTLASDPNFYLQEYLHAIQNEIDIDAESAKMKEANKEDFINEERSYLFTRLSNFQNRAKKSLDELYGSYLEEMKHLCDSVEKKCKTWTEEFYENQQTSQKTEDYWKSITKEVNTLKTEKLVPNIAELKKIILNYDTVNFVKVDMLLRKLGFFGSPY